MEAEDLCKSEITVEEVEETSTRNNRPYIVYMHKNTANGKLYIGITSTSLKKRSGGNGMGYRNNKLFYRAIQKYGWDAFEHIVIKSNLSKSEAAELEIDLISKFKSNDPEFGYNISSGGESGNAGCKASDELREKFSRMYSGKNNPMYGRRGVNNPNYGRPCREETKELLRNALLGRYVSPETRQKISESLKKRGRWAGEDNPMYGRRRGDAPQARRVICIETGEIYDCIKDAAEDKKIHENGISYCCNGKYKTSGGYHWMYLDRDRKAIR